ncbi:MAG: GNAT family N-acetyltransferase [Flavobacteriales bacterium]|jgi:ribosomal-protein-alanine N-acetyltransferase
MSGFFLNGSSVFLRALSMEDATPEYLDWINNPETTRGLVAGNFPSNMESLKAYIASVTTHKDCVILAVCDRSTSKHIGNVKLDRIDWISGTCELGILIGSADHRGKGIGTEVCGMMIRYAFQTLNLRKVLLAVYSNNPAAMRAYEKAGFTEEGRLKEHVYCEGMYVDKILMSAFKN